MTRDQMVPRIACSMYLTVCYVSCHFSDSIFFSHCVENTFLLLRALDLWLVLPAK